MRIMILQVWADGSSRIRHHLFIPNWNIRSFGLKDLITDHARLLSRQINTEDGDFVVQVFISDDMGLVEYMVYFDGCFVKTPCQAGEFPVSLSDEEDRKNLKSLCNVDPDGVIGG